MLNPLKVFLRALTVLILVLISGFASVCGQNPTGRFVASPELLGSSVSAVVFDLKTGEILEAQQADQRLCPASTWKIAITTAAIDILGADFKFRTVLAYRGKIVDGVLRGDLIIVGGGDPSLGSSHMGPGFDYVLNAWVDAVKEAGIDSISGSVIGNAAHFQGDGLPRTRIWEDMANYYGTAVSGLSFKDNTYEVRFSTPKEPDLPAVLKGVYPQVPGLDISSEVMSSTIQRDQAFIFGAPLDMKRVVRGTLPLGRENYVIKGSLPDPALFTAFHLRDRLFKAGIAVTDHVESELKRVEEGATLKVIHQSVSPDLASLVKHINRQSDNLFAETLLIQMGVKSGDPTIEGGLEALRAYYENICASAYPFFAYDGSGLSRFNAISANQMREIMLHAMKSTLLKESILEELPVAGKDGTLKYFGRGTVLDGNLRGKSGSMEGVRAYAGYFSARTGRQLGFVVMVNNFDGQGNEIRTLIEAWLVDLVEGR